MAVLATPPEATKPQVIARITTSRMIAIHSGIPGTAIMIIETINYDVLIAGSMFSLIPVFIVFIAFQRYFVDGMTVGAVKG